MKTRREEKEKKMIKKVVKMQRSNKLLKKNLSKENHPKVKKIS